MDAECGDVGTNRGAKVAERGEDRRRLAMVGYYFDSKAQVEPP